jgi:hypothetical protein
VIPMKRAINRRSQSGVIMGIFDALLIATLTTAFIFLIVGTSSYMYLKLKLYERDSFALDYARSIAMETTDFETNRQAQEMIIIATQNLFGKAVGNREPAMKISFDSINQNRAIVVTSTLNTVNVLPGFSVDSISDVTTGIYRRTVGFMGFECKAYSHPVPGHRGGQTIAWVPIVEAPPVGTLLSAQTWWLQCPFEFQYKDIASDHHEPPCRTFFIKGQRVHVDGKCEFPSVGVGERSHEHVMPADSTFSDQTTHP